jgi:glycogen debranching enzyme
VELQGYRYAAKLAMAELCLELGDEREAKHLAAQAARLRTLVEEHFWMSDAEFYAVALDGEKRQVRSVTSNPGHLLWCGLPHPERAMRVADRMLREDMFSGWGLRTISSENPAYNPLSYQLGSVWPHDTALAAAGLWRYGLFDQAERLLYGILEAATVFDQHRLPELFCGMPLSEGGPTPYANANSPQAWAAAVPLLTVQLVLGIVPDAPRRRCYLSPRLPAWLDRLEVHDLRVGEGRLRVHLSRDGASTRVDTLEGDGVEVLLEKPAAPLWGSFYEDTGR